MGKLLFFALALALGAGSSPDLEWSILYFSGASCIEELSEDELQCYTSLAERPVDLNLAGRARLESSGLLSAYQAVSLLDYRSRTGDILSFAELALVDGFTEEFVQALRPFVKIESSSAPGQRIRSRYSHSLTAGGSVRRAVPEGGPAEYTGKVRYEGAVGEMAEFYWTSRTTYSDPQPRPGTFSAAYYGRRHLGKVVLGHFGARFGQGLASWTGFSMSSYSSAASFSRNGSGVAATGSATPERFGAAAELNFGLWSVSGAYSLTGKEGLISVSKSSRLSTVGLLATTSAGSVFWRFGVPDATCFGEVCSDYSGRMKAVVGMTYVPLYAHKLVAQLRYFDAAFNQYSGVALGAERTVQEGLNYIFTLDAGVKIPRELPLWPHCRFRVLAVVKREFAAGDWSLLPSLRYAGRLLPGNDAPLRHDLRAELGASCGLWQLGWRGNVLWCKGFAWQTHVQAGLKSDSGVLSLRAGAFAVDNWDDRIYVYQQDAPGNFNVPAMYGRGFHLALFGALYLSRAHSVWLRADVLQYPWNPEPKSGKWEVKLQYRWRVF